jgi:diguanylate cyclase (GGDEF)-like protein
MLRDSKLHDEAARVAALGRLDILDTPQEDQFDKITALVSQVLEIPHVAISMLDDHRQWFKSSQGVPVREAPREISFCKFTILEPEPMVVPDARLDSRLCDNPSVLAGRILSYAGVPLVTPDGYAVGTLCAFASQPRHFTQGQVELLSRFGEIVMDQLQMRQLAQRDQLTGTLTRRGLVARAEGEIAEARLNNTPSALVMFDIDHFKSVNDRFGHATGDAVLKAVVASCEAVKPPGSFLGRVGGEEFAILLPRTSVAEAIGAAERVRATIERLAIDGGQLQVTASFGVALLDASITNADQWLAAADVPLYLAKRTGRNQCRCSG